MYVPAWISNKSPVDTSALETETSVGISDSASPGGFLTAVVVDCSAEQPFLAVVDIFELEIDGISVSQETLFLLSEQSIFVVSFWTSFANVPLSTRFESFFRISKTSLWTTSLVSFLTILMPLIFEEETNCAELFSAALGFVVPDAREYIRLSKTGGGGGDTSTGFTSTALEAATSILRFEGRTFWSTSGCSLLFHALKNYQIKILTKLPSNTP